MADWETAGETGWETAKAPPSTTERAIDAVAGPYDAALSLASSAVAGPVSGLAGLAGAALPGEPGQGARAVEATQDALTYQPRTQSGKKIAGVVAKPFEMLAEGADKAGGAVTDKTGSPLAGTAVNTAIQGIPLALAPFLKRMGPIKSAAEKNPKLAANVEAAKKADLRMTPEESGSGIVPKTLASLSGEPKLTNLVSRKNAPTIDRIISEDLGLPKGTALDRDTIAKVRRDAHEPFKEVRALGQIPADPEYGQALQKIVSSHEGAEKSFPTGKKDPVYSLVESLNQPSFDAGAAVDKIKLLREDADAAYRARDTRMGKAYKQAALALEDAIDRHLQRLPGESPQAGQPGTALARQGEAARVEKDITPGAEPARGTSDLLKRFREARVRIAKSYAADKALNETTGHVNPQAYADALKKGKPLSGGAREVGEFARAFPRSAQKTDKLGSTGPTLADAITGILSGGTAAHLAHAGVAASGGTGLAVALAAALARPATRAALASRLGQHFTGPKDWSAAELARQIQGNSGVAAAETSEGQRK